MKINISQCSCFPKENARDAILLLNGYQADSIKTNPAIVVETFCISFWCICCFSYKIQMKREWEESSFHTVFCRTLSLIFSTKSLFGIGLENISILMLSVCKHEQYALMVTKSFGTTSTLYAHILRIHILTLLDDKGISVSCQFLNHCSTEPERSEVSACCCYCKTCSQNMGCALLLFPKL